jgi:hypothetical protein
MVSRIAGGGTRARSSRRQLPITGFAHKAAVVGDGRIAAGLILTARNMAAEGCRAAVLDR